MPRSTKDPAKPRGKMSPYAFFVQACRDEHKRKHPNEQIVFAEFSKKCAARWKVRDTTMSPKEKRRFEELAERDRDRYEREMANYVPPKGEKRRKRQRKDPNAPKRALSAFFWFCADERPAVRSRMPESGVGDIAKELGRMWNEVPDETKRKYEAMAQKDKKRYEKEMEKYKSGGQAAVAAAVDEDEDEGSDDE